jgi:RNase H-like domain found in reverse transcriptase
MNPHEQNYHAQEQELLANVEALRHWRSYLHGQAFLVQTDHASLQYLTTQDYLTPRQVRWLERLIEFDFKIVQISGKTNLVADALSLDLPKTYLPVTTQTKPFYLMPLDKQHHTQVILWKWALRGETLSSHPGQGDETVGQRIAEHSLGRR